MNSSEYKISLDIHEINSQHLLYCKQGDTQRKIIATLVEESELYHIAEDCTAVFTAFKPDGKVIFNQAHIAGDTIVYEFTEQTANVSGKLDCELRLYGYDNALITSPRFTLVAHPTVYVDVVESKDEVNVLTALISEATELIDSVNTKLNNGEFIPKLSIGTVTTLPAGSNATAEFTGSGEAPILNLGIPQGDEGQAEGLIPDSALSEDSTKPVQNKVITNALKTLSQETENMLETKADKAEGMGLSANSFTDEEKEKLAGIEAGANKYVLEDGAVSTAKIASGAVTTSKMANAVVNTEKLANAVVNTEKLANAAVTRAKLANDALYSPIKSVDTSKTPNYEITVADIGLTLREHSGASPGCVFVFNDANCTDIPVGVEIAFINWASQSRTELHFTGVHVVMAGEKYINNSDKTYKLRIAEQYGMIAVKKIIGDSNGVTVLVTGNVEVVE